MNESDSIELIVGLANGDGKLLISQPLDEFLMVIEVFLY